MSEVIEGMFSIYANSAQKKYDILKIAKSIPDEQLSKEKLLEVLEKESIDVEIKIDKDEHDLIQYRIMQLPDKCENCGERAVSWVKFCGVNVCSKCEQHQGLAQCFCGWNQSASERLPDDIGNSIYKGNGHWEVDY